MSKKIIFFGTPSFAVKCLEKMVDENLDVIAVVTSPDRPAGRGRKIRTSAVKQFSITQKITLLQPSNLKDPKFIEKLIDLEPDLMVVVAFRMLPKIVWSIPNRGTFNLHASLLPQYRGSAPINWAIINQEKHSGVTTFLINEEIDTGSILLQKKVAIDKKETAGSLQDKLAIKGSELICETVKGIFEESIRPRKQLFIGTEKIAPKLNKENVFINWNKSLEEIQAKIKGLSPYPGAKFNWIENQKNLLLKYLTQKLSKKSTNLTHNESS